MLIDLDKDYLPEAQKTNPQSMLIAVKSATNNDSKNFNFGSHSQRPTHQTEEHFINSNFATQAYHQSQNNAQ